MKVDYRMHCYDIVTNPRWWTATNTKNVMSAYLSEKWSDYNDIQNTESDSDCDKNDLCGSMLLQGIMGNYAIL